MPDDAKAKIDELRNRESLTDAEGKVHRKPAPPPIQVVKKGAYSLTDLLPQRAPHKTP